MAVRPCSAGTSKGSIRSCPPPAPCCAARLVLLPLSLAIDRPWTLTPSPQSVQALIALSLVSTALAFVIYFRLIARLGSVATTSVAYLRVPTGVGLGMVFLGETLAPTAWGGLVLVIGGVLAMTLPARSARPLTAGPRQKQNPRGASRGVRCRSPGAAVQLPSGLNLVTPRKRLRRKLCSSPPDAVVRLMKSKITPSCRP